MATSAPVKLLYVTTVALTPWSFLRGQNEYMRERGFELHVACSPGPLVQLVADRDGAQAHRVYLSREISPIRDLISLLQLVRIMRQLRPDLLHVSTPKAALLGAIAGWACDVPARVYLVRGLITENACGLRRKMFRRLERLTARLCHLSICVSPSLLSFARREGILDANQGRIVASGMSNGIDAERFNPAYVSAANLSPAGPVGGAEAMIVLGFVGRLTRDKGVEDLAAAWEILRQAEPSLILLLIGPWEDEDPVAGDVRRRLERDSRVVCAGRVDDTRPYYRAMSVFAFPSHGTEGFPNAPMEAAAMGLPVVATRVVGSVDAVAHGVTGTLVPPRDIGALAEAIRGYLRDPDLRRRHGAAGRERVLREFRQEVIWEALYQEYVRLLRERGLPVPAAAGADGGAEEGREHERNRARTKRTHRPGGSAAV